MNFRGFRVALANSSAVVAIALAAPAMAQVPELRVQSGGFDLRLTGGVGVQGALFDDNDPTTENSDGEIDLFARLNAEWTSPDGILIGANVEVSNQKRETEALNTGEIYGFVASDYGRVEVGLQDGPADVLAFHAPVIALGQIRGDAARYGASQALLSALDTRDSFKVIYLSPPVSGIRAGVSWSPKFKQNADAVNPRNRTIVRDAVELGVQFQQPVGDWILGFSGGYAFGNADRITTRADLNSWSVGTELRRGPLRLGGAYVRRGDSNRLDRNFDQWEINAGASWVEDKWGAAFSAATTQQAGQVTRSFGVGGYYALSRNFQLRGDVVQFRETRFARPTQNGLVAVLELQFTI
jgi:Gram-negative porin